MDWKSIAKDYNEVFGFNIIPLVNKAPKIDWKKFTIEEMTAEILECINWNSATNGIGAISGINELRCLDFDIVTDIEIVYKFAEALGLGRNYEWIVKSGSGKGYHLWFYSSDDDNYLNGLGGEKSYYKFNSKEDNLCDHIELRWKNCQTVLPPSLHQSGNEYSFVNLKDKGLPETEPKKVWVGKLLEVLKENCLLNEGTEQVKLTKKKVENIRIKKLTEYEKRMVKHVVNLLKGMINNYDDWYYIGFAFASLGEKGRKYFIKISLGNKKYPDDTTESLNKKFDGFLKDYTGEITIGSLFEIANKYGWQRPLQQFWRINNNRAEINKTQLFELLEAEGFGKLFFGKDYLLIQEHNNIVREVTTVNIKDFVLDYLSKALQNRNHSIVKEAILRSARTIFSDGTLEFLATKEMRFVEDTKEKAYFFFKNCFVEVTADEILCKDYKNLHLKIWENQLIQRKFSLSEQPTVFAKFLSNICRNDSSRFDALRSSIGFLLHGYKDPTRAKTIIFIDEKLSENAFGRSGKGLVAKGIKELKNLLRLDGKNFSFEKSFPFQSVNPDTQIIFFDDVSKRFNFNKLFSIITEGITVEKKNKNELTIPFEKTPKLLITTNHTISGSDDSSIARQFVIEFSDFYNAKHEPINDFGKMFFNEWSDEEFNSFYNFMLECIQFYLKYGLKEYEYVNLTKKKLIDETSQEFEEFISELDLKIEHNKKDLFERFKNDYEDFGQIKQNTFTKWTKVYAELHDLRIDERKSGADRYITFRNKSEKAVDNGQLDLMRTENNEDIVR